MMEHFIPLPALEAGAAATRRTALLLAYRFPPHESIASHRAQALYRYLGRYGWNPLVLTTRTDGAPADVIQTDDPSLAGKLEGHGAFDPSRDAHPAARFGKLVGYAWQAVKGVLRHLPRWHDRYAQWSYGIVDEAVRVGRERNVELVWATLSPLSLAPAAIHIARQLRVPCVLDLRDPPEEGLGGAPARWLTAALRAADAVTVAAPSCITPLVLNARGNRPPPLILSGSWHDGPIAPGPARQFRIVHAGTWHRGYDAGPLLSALIRLSHELPDFSQNTRAVFMGKGSNWVRETASFDAAATLVEIAPLMPYAQVQHELRQAGVLLIVRGGDAYKAGAITGKIFDYAAYGTPLLSIGGRRDMHGGLVGWLGGLWTDSMDEIAGFLHTQYSRWRESGTTRVQRNPDALAYLSQPRMAGEFAAVFDAALSGNPATAREEHPWAAERQQA